jgi:hypothetical protein
MAETKSYSIEVQGDFLTKQTHAKPTLALAELIPDHASTRQRDKSAPSTWLSTATPKKILLLGGNP